MGCLGMGLFGRYAVEHLENFFVNDKDQRDIENNTGHTRKGSFVKRGRTLFPQDLDEAINRILVLGRLETLNFHNYLVRRIPS